MESVSGIVSSAGASSAFSLGWTMWIVAEFLPCALMPLHFPAGPVQFWAGVAQDFAIFSCEGRSLTEL